MGGWLLGAAGRQAVVEGIGVAGSLKGLSETPPEGALSGQLNFIADDALQAKEYARQAAANTGSGGVTAVSAAQDAKTAAEAASAGMTDIATAVGAVQTAVDGLPAAPSASDIWNTAVFSTPGGDTSAGSALGFLYALYDIIFQSGFRSALEPWFVFLANGIADQFDFQNLNPSFMGFGDPADQGEGESDLDYMNRVSGGIAWNANLLGSGRPFANCDSNGIQWTLIYWPLPSAGAITEPGFVNAMLAVKPEAWADLADGGLSMADALSTPWKVALSGAVEAVRYTGAAHFLVVQHKVEDGAGIMPPTGRQALLHPMNISPGAQLPTETDVEFLNRIGAGGLTWEWKSGANSIAYATDTDMGAGVVEEYYYSPLDRFPNAQRMLVYTPNSGPPDRSLWEDAVALMSRLPISFE